MPAARSATAIGAAATKTATTPLAPAFDPEAAAAGIDLYLAGHASITEIQWAGTSGVVLRFDDRSHLAPLERRRAS